MTYPVEVPLSRQFGNGISAQFAAGFSMYELTDLYVELRDTDDVQVTSVLNGPGTYDHFIGAYSFDNVLYTNVAVNFNNAPPSGYKIGLTRVGAQSQTLDLMSGGVLPAESLERRLDRMTSLIQDLYAALQRSPLGPVASNSLYDMGGRVIRNAADPVENHDVVTKGYLATSSLAVGHVDGVTVNGYASLRALAVGGNEPVTAFTTGAVTISDGGDGWYYYDPNSTQTDSVLALTPDSGGGRWLIDSATKHAKGTIRRAKYALTSRANVATPAADPELAGWFLEANTVYEVRGYLQLSTLVGGAGNFRCNFSSGLVPQTVSIWMQSINELNSTQNSAKATLGDFTFLVGGGVLTWVAISGFVMTNASAAGQIDFYWSQNTTDANAMTVHAGSWIEFAQNL